MYQSNLEIILQLFFLDNMHIYIYGLSKCIYVYTYIYEEREIEIEKRRDREWETKIINYTWCRDSFSLNVWRGNVHFISFVFYIR